MRQCLLTLVLLTLACPVVLAAEAAQAPAPAAAQAGEAAQTPAPVLVPCRLCRYVPVERLTARGFFPVRRNEVVPADAGKNTPAFNRRWSWDKGTYTLVQEVQFNDASGYRGIACLETWRRPRLQGARYDYLTIEIYQIPPALSREQFMTNYLSQYETPFRRQEPPLFGDICLLPMEGLFHTYCRVVLTGDLLIYMHLTEDMGVDASLLGRELLGAALGLGPAPQAAAQPEAAKPDAAQPAAPVQPSTGAATQPEGEGKAKSQTP